jgi:hypothetical protein
LTVEVIAEIRANLTHRPAGYGTVGICPAFSCASRAALSPASWVASSFGLKVPAAGAVPAAGVEVAAGVVVVLV